MFLGYGDEPLGKPRSASPSPRSSTSNDWDGAYAVTRRGERMTEIPRIVSADDHVVEPPDVFTSRLPAKYRDVGPHVVRGAGGGDDVPRRQVRLRDGLRRATARSPTGGSTRTVPVPHTRLGACAGFAPEDVQVVPMTYDEMRPGCYQQAPRLDDMDLNWVEASLCFPTFPRFCGQTFLEADDKDLALLCVQAYNDWMVEEWCAGSGGRLIPLCLIPLWDPVLAAAEVRRNAARGVRAVCFSELPGNLGLPSVHDPERATGIRSSRRATRPAPSSACTAARGRRCRRRPPTRRRRCRRR